MITKSERCREILAVLARHGIGLVDDYRQELAKLKDEVMPVSATISSEILANPCQTSLTAS
jgi:hypothetical protein